MSKEIPVYSLVARVDGVYIYTPYASDGFTIIRAPLLYPVFDERMVRFSAGRSGTFSCGPMQVILFFLAHGRWLKNLILGKSAADIGAVRRLCANWWRSVITPLLDSTNNIEKSVAAEVIVDLYCDQHTVLTFSERLNVVSECEDYLDYSWPCTTAIFKGGQDMIHTNSRREAINALFIECRSAGELYERLTLMDGSPAYRMSTVEELKAMASRERRITPTVSNETFLRCYGFPLDEVAAIVGDLNSVIGPPLRDMLMSKPLHKGILA